MRPGGRPDRARRRSARASRVPKRACAPTASGATMFVARQATFAGLPQVLAGGGLAAVNRGDRRPRRLVDADRQSRSRVQLQGGGAARHADEPVAQVSRPGSSWHASTRTRCRRCSLRTPTNHTHRSSRRLLKQQPVTTTDALERLVRTTLNTTYPRLAKTRRQDVGASHVPGAAGGRQR